MKNYVCVFVLIILMPLSSSATALKVKKEYGQIIDQCSTKSSKKVVWIIKQWHLSPGVNTKTGDQNLPQKVNQTAIFKQLDEWITQGKMREIVAEGCEGELTAQSKISFQNWTIEDLKKSLNKPEFSEILTSVPLKLEAKYEDRLNTYCGDSDELIKASSLALSDARGAVGFFTRLSEHDAKTTSAQRYLRAVIELYKLPPSTTQAQAIAHLKLEIKNAITRFKTLTDKRNQKFVEAALASKDKNVALIVGGLHASGIKLLLEKAQVACRIYQPVGYSDDENELLKKLDEAIR